MTLRDYQVRTSDLVFKEWDDHRSTLMVYPTGCGKTIVFADVIRRMQPRRALVVAHREELIYQAREKIAAVTGLDCEIEMADLSASTNLFNRTPVIVATVQTLIAGTNGYRRMNRFRPQDFGLLVIDEAHHAVADSYRAVLDYFMANEQLKVLGVTATPDRADEEALGKVFESVADDYEILDAIHDGWLVDIEQLFVPVEGLDFSHIRTTAGDLNGADLSAVMEAENSIQGVVHPTLEAVFDLKAHTLNNIPVEQWTPFLTEHYGAKRRAIVFTASVKQAEMLCNIFNRACPGLAGWVCGNTNKDERRMLLSDFSAGKTSIVCNCGVLTEGFDDPGVELIVMARPTKSRALYAQMCLDSETEVLVLDLNLIPCWKRRHELCAMDLVAAFNMWSERIEFVPIDSEITRPRLVLEGMYGISSPMMDVRVTDQHDMVVRFKHGRKRTRGPWTKVQARLLDGGFEVPCAAKHGNLGGLDLTDDELRFIGWFLTDGTLNKRNGQITITQGEHQPWVGKIEDCIKGCGFKFGKSFCHRKTQFNETSRCVRFTISKGIPRGRDSHLSGWKKLEPYISKDLSPILFRLTKAQVDVLLEAIHLGDGCKQLNQHWTRRSYHICSANKTFVDRLQILCTLNGYSTNVSEQHYNKMPLWMVHAKPSYVRTVRTHASDSRPVWKEQTDCSNNIVWCLSNRLGTLVTRRHGKVVIVGNCGRSTRPLAGVVDGLESAAQRKAAIAQSPKSKCVVMDFVGNSGRHKLITAADILGGNVCEAAIELAVRKAKERGEARSVTEDLDEAEALIRRQMEEARLAVEARKAKLVAKVKFTAQRVNPFDAFQLQPARDRGWDTGKTLSEKQRALLMRQGIDPDGMNYAAARQLINEMFRRWNNHLCTMKQAACLKRAGYNPKDITIEKAGQLITQLKQNHWKRPNNEDRTDRTEDRQYHHADADESKGVWAD